MRPPITAILILAAGATAAAQDQQVGARTKAMGGSYTAFEDDPVSIWLNPAGIATQPDGGAIAYQTYTIYEMNIRGDEMATTVPAEYAWGDPAIIPSFIGATFQLGSPESPHALGFCFTTPFRMKLVFDDADNPFPHPSDLHIDQVFYRLRGAYAFDLRFRPPGEEGYFTHLAVGLAADISITNASLTEFILFYDPDSGLEVGETTFNASVTDMGFGGGAGLLLGLYDNMSSFKVNLGAAYQSKASYDFSVQKPNVPMFDWPNQFQGGVTFYMFEGFPLRLTFDAQLIQWDKATRGSQVAGRDDFKDTLNYSAGAEFRIRASESVTLYPRVGLRLYDAPWDDDDKAKLPAIGRAILHINAREEAFLIFTCGAGVGWSSENGKLRTFDLAFDVGGDAPGMAVGFTMEF